MQWLRPVGEPGESGQMFFCRCALVYPRRRSYGHRAPKQAVMTCSPPASGVAAFTRCLLPCGLSSFFFDPPPTPTSLSPPSLSAGLFFGTLHAVLQVQVPGAAHRRLLTFTHFPGEKNPKNIWVHTLFSRQAPPTSRQLSHQNTCITCRHLQLGSTMISKDSCNLNWKPWKSAILA